MSWYDFKKVKDGIAPSIIEVISIACYSKDHRDWSCYDEVWMTEETPFKHIISSVENGYLDKNSDEKKRVFIHCTNKDIYELKVEKVKYKETLKYYGKPKKVKPKSTFIETLVCISFVGLAAIGLGTVINYIAEVITQWLV